MSEIERIRFTPQGQDLITASRIGDVRWLENIMKKINYDHTILGVYNDKVMHFIRQKQKERQARMYN